jgi:FimV-like protein
MTAHSKHLSGCLKWRPLALACAMGMLSLSAQALNLGKLSVMSGLNEPLRAELDITQFTLDDLRSLKVQLATRQAFEQAGMRYNPALADLQAKVNVRSNGQPFIALMGQHPAQDNFIDLILDTQWAAGRLVLNYTVLLSDKQASADTREPAVVRQDIPPSPLTASTDPTAVKASAAEEAGSLTVQPGDTASKLARRHLTPDISLEQMLVAMLQSNPEAFIEGNVNWIRAGARLKMPNAQEAQQTPADEARQAVIQQTTHFAAYAQRLASAPVQVGASAGREATGTVHTDTGKALPPTAQDKLTLTQGEASPQTEEAQLAQARETQAAAEQLAALNKNVESLQALTPASTPASAAAIPQTETAAPAPTSAQASWLDEMSENPVALGGIASLLTGLAVCLLWMRRRSEQSTSLWGKEIPSGQITGNVGNDLKARLAGLDLNLDTPSTAMAPSPLLQDNAVPVTQVHADTDQSKLTLAMQLLEKGETDLANRLLESVAHTATGELRLRAQQLLGPGA